MQGTHVYGHLSAKPDITPHSGPSATQRHHIVCVRPYSPFIRFDAGQGGCYEHDQPRYDG